MRELFVNRRNDGEEETGNRRNVTRMEITCEGCAAAAVRRLMAAIVVREIDISGKTLSVGISRDSLQQT
jgi:hypothetical protein